MKQNMINLLIVLLFSINIGVSAAEYYIRAGATGNHTGLDWENAWTELPYHLEGGGSRKSSNGDLERGATYYIADGEYPSFVFDSEPDGERVITIRKATTEAHGTDTGWDDSYGNGVALFTSSEPGSIFDFKTGYYTFDGQTGEFDSGHGIHLYNQHDLAPVNGGAAVSVFGGYAAPYLTFKHVNIEGSGWGRQCKSRLMYLVGLTDHLIMQHCYVHESCQEWFDQSDPGEYTLIEHCYFQNGGSGNPDMHSVGIWIRGTRMDQKVILRYNVFENFMQAGGTGYITLGWASSTDPSLALSGGYEIYGNIFFESSELAGPSRLIGSNGSGIFPAEIYNTKIYNNTIVGMKGNSGNIAFQVGTGEGNEAVNNIWVDCERVPGFTNIVSRNNSMNEWTDEIFVDRENGDFRLSHQISAGEDLGNEYETDAAGNERATWSLGAYEFVEQVTQSVYYVRAEATGFNDGSDWNNAWSELPDVLERGATYYLADGEYPSCTLDDPEEEGKYITIKKASVLDHGTNLGWDDSYGDGTVQFEPLFIRTGFWIIDGSYRSSKDSGHGIRIPISGEEGGHVQEHGITVANGNNRINNITVKYVEFVGTFEGYPEGWLDERGWERWAVKNGYEHALGGDNLYIGHCYFHHLIGPMQRTRNIDGIIIEHNLYRDNKSYHGGPHGDAIQLWGVPNSEQSACNAVIRNNEFVDVEGTGAINLAWGVSNIRIYGNIIRFSQGIGGYGTAVIYAYDGEVGPLCVYNNVFFNSSSKMGLRLAGDAVLIGTDRYAYNNLWFACPDTNAVGINYEHEGHNYISQSKLSWDFTPDATDQISEEDPFVNASLTDFSLASGLAGKDLSKESWWDPRYDSAEDAAGNLRGADGIWDIGAYEYLSGAGNQSPRISSLSDITCTEGELIDFNITVTDQNAEDTITLNVQNLPQGATLTKIEDRVWNFNWQTDIFSNENSPYSLTFIANDGSNDSNPESITITVSNIENDIISALYHLNGNAQDSSGNGFHGTIYGDPQVVSGRIGEAYEFDGGDDYIEAAWNSPIQGEDQSFTIAAWVNTASTTGSHWIIGDNSQYRRFLFGLSGGELAVRWRYGVSNTDYSLNTGQTIQGDWTHVAVTYDSSDRSVSIYINGSQAIRDATTQPLGIRDFNVLQIGRGYSAGDAEYFEGIIDEVRIYARLLNPIEIQDLYLPSQNTPPVIAPISNVQVYEGEKISFDISVLDQDAMDAIILGSANLPEGANVTQAQPGIWHFEWQTDFSTNQNSPYTITFIANDGSEDSDPVSVSIIVNDVNSNLNLTNKPAWVGMS